MKLTSRISAWFFVPVLLALQAAAQTPASAPVPYSSVNELNQLLTQIEEASKASQLDLARLRVERWKTDSGTKTSSLADVESIQRNLQNAMPGLISQLRNSPEDLAATFKLYRNLDALYDVFTSLAESAGAFGSRDEYQSLQNDLGALERSRRSFADRMETLSGAKEGELAKLRTQLQAAKAAATPAAPPKKVVVDDTEEPKKPVAKKTARKKPPAQNPVPGTTTPAPADQPKSQ